MAVLRAGTKFPSGLDGWYVYHDCGEDKLYINQLVDGQYFTKEDLKFLIEKLQYALERYFNNCEDMSNV